MNKFSRLCCVLLTVVNCYSNTDETKCSLCVWSGRAANKEALHVPLNEQKLRNILSLVMSFIYMYTLPIYYKLAFGEKE